MSIHHRKGTTDGQRNSSTHSNLLKDWAYWGSLLERVWRELWMTSMRTYYRKSSRKHGWKPHSCIPETPPTTSLQAALLVGKSLLLATMTANVAMVKDLVNFISLAFLLKNSLAPRKWLHSRAILVVDIEWLCWYWTSQRAWTRNERRGQKKL